MSGKQRLSPSSIIPTSDSFPAEDDLDGSSPDGELPFRLKLLSSGTFQIGESRLT